MSVMITANTSAASSCSNHPAARCYVKYFVSLRTKKVIIYLKCVQINVAGHRGQ